MISVEQVMMDGLVDYWSFNGNLTDSVTQLAMSPAGGYSYVADRFGRPGLAIDASYMSVPDCTSSETFLSVVMWANSQSNNGRFLYSLNSLAYWLQTSNGQFSVVVQHHVLFTTSSSVSLFPINEWTHIAVTFDSSVAKLYINNVLSYQYARFVYWLAYHNGNDCVLGQTLPLLTFVDDLMFFNRTLNDTEISTLYGFYN